MNRWLAASMLAALCAGCSKTEQPAASVPPPAQEAAAAPVAATSPTAPLSAPGSAGTPTAAEQANPVVAPTVSAMRTRPSLAPSMAVPGKVPMARPEHAGPGATGAGNPGIERLSLLPGTRVPTPAPDAVPEVTVRSAIPPAAPEVLEDEPAVASRSMEIPEPPVTPLHVPRKNVVDPDAAPEVITQEPVRAAVATPSAVAVPMPSAVQPGRQLKTINELVLDCMRRIPSGGAYRADANAISLLKQAITVSDQRLQIIPDLARPSFCSSATYLVFLSVMDELHQDRRLQMSDQTLEALLVHGQKDGEGVWGRWNANGPGTARLFHETGLGRSFSNPMTALPGDFLKIWWNDEIGAKERGHSVIFLGMAKADTGEMGVRYWSSNKPGGFGEAVAPLSKVKRMLFSRLENPRAVVNAVRIPTLDRYLADMLKRASTEEEMFRLCGMH